MGITVLHIMLFLSGGLLVYTYLIYPRLMAWFTRHSVQHHKCFETEEALPQVSVLMAVHNEEKIILSKLATFKNQDYPIDKLDIYIGSDNSSDATNQLIEDYIVQHSLAHVHFFPFSNRQGKPGVIDQLSQRAFERYPQGNSHILLLTDASVLLEPNVIFDLVKHFKDEQIGLVDSLQLHTGIQGKGISKSEDRYISGEVRLKHCESLYNRKMMGPFGGCYALRSNLYRPIPPTYLVDDFFLAMHVLSSDFDAINEPKAICKESVSQEIKEEYKRKKRISAGNFQNLVHYKHLLIPKGDGIAFNLWSHKVLRWLGPFLILISFSTNVILACKGNLFDVILLILQGILLFGVPILDWTLEKRDIHIPLLRAIRYFFMMNFALFEGFIRYLKGIKSNVWQPTKRPDSTEYNT